METRDTQSTIYTAQVQQRRVFNPLSIGRPEWGMLQADSTGLKITGLNGQSLTRVIGKVNFTADYVSNVGLSNTYNGITGATVTVTVSRGDSLIWFDPDMVCQMASPNVGTFVQWALVVDGAVVDWGPMVLCPTASQAFPNWTGARLLYGPGTILGPLSAGSHTFTIQVYSNTATTSGFYLRPASVQQWERLKFQVIEQTS